MERTEDQVYVEKRRGNGMTIGIIFAAIIVLAVVAAFAFGLVGVKQTQDGKMP